MKTIVYESYEWQNEEFSPKYKFYILNALFQRVYFSCKIRLEAQEACDEMYGKGKYTIKCENLIKPKGEITARGSENNLSRKGSKHVSIQSRQGFGVNFG